MYVPSQWETTLYCNVVCHWLGTCSKWYRTGLLFLWDWLGNVPILWRAYLLWVTTDGLRLAESFSKRLCNVFSKKHFIDPFRDSSRLFTCQHLHLLVHQLSPSTLDVGTSFVTRFYGIARSQPFWIVLSGPKIFQNHWSPENFDRIISTFVVSTELADGLAPY